MLEKFRKSVLCIGFTSAIILLLIVAETGKFENITGIMLSVFSMFYMFWFTAANWKK